MTIHWQEDVLAAQLLNNDTLAEWERRKKQQAERTILLAAKIIAQSIGPTFASQFPPDLLTPSPMNSFSEGYAWCVECIRRSVYASLATELEMNKVVEQLRHGQLDQAVEELLVFNNKEESKVASAASNNLALICVLVGLTNGRGGKAPSGNCFVLRRSAATTIWRMRRNIASRHSAWTGTTPTHWSTGETSTSVRAS